MWFTPSTLRIVSRICEGLLLAGSGSSCFPNKLPLRPTSRPVSHRPYVALRMSPNRCWTSRVLILRSTAIFTICSLGGRVLPDSQL